MNSRSTKKGGARKLQKKLLLAPESTYQGGARKGSAPEVLHKGCERKKFSSREVLNNGRARDNFISRSTSKRRCKKKIPSAPEVNTKVVQENYELPKTKKGARNKISY
jgi:hypothetical protein